VLFVRNTSDLFISLLLFFFLFSSFSSFFLIFIFDDYGRSQLPHGLRHVVFARSIARIVGSNPTQMSVCVYSVYVVLCVGCGLATGWSLVQGVLSTVYIGSRNWKRSHDPTGGCRAIIIIIFDYYVNIECSSVINECGANDGMRNGRGNWSNAKKTCPIAALPNTNPAWAAPWFNPRAATMGRWRLTPRARPLSSVNARNPSVLESREACNVQQQTGFK
jgi:hypothetical protein